MTEIKGTDEARLLAVYRAIKKFGKPALISSDDVGPAVASLDAVFENLDELEKEYSGNELRALILGFVAGLGASRLPELEEQLAALEEYQAEQFVRPQYPANVPSYEEEMETSWQGGPTGGTAVGQGDDPRYVKQSGVSSNSKKDTKDTSDADS